MTHFAKMACSSESSVSALPELELSELEKEQIVIVIPSSLPPGSTPPPHPHPGNVVTIISTPARGGWVGLGWVKASPGRLPTVRAAFPAGPDWAAVPGCPVTRPTGLLTAPRPRGGARGREMPPCLCVCALVCLRGGGGAVAHLLAPLLFGVGAHGAGKCVPGAPGPGREARGGGGYKAMR